MEKIRSYFYVQIKRVIKLLPSILAISLFMYLSMGMIACVFMEDYSNSSDKQKYQIGVVGDLSDTYLGFGIKAVKLLDDSRFMIDFHFISEKKAKEGLLNGKLTAYIIVPEGFVDSIIYGRNDKQIIFVASEGQRGIADILMEELSAVVSVLVTHSQSAIYGMQHILRAENKTDIWNEATNELNLKLIRLVLNRTDLCKKEILGVSNGLSTLDFYLCSFMLFFMSLSGITCIPLFSRRNGELQRIAASKRVRAFWQVISEYLSYIVVTLLIMIELFMILFFMSLVDELELLITLFPIVLMISAMQFFYYELTTGIVSSILLQFISSVGMAYISGYFYPASFLPKVMQKIGEKLPTGIALRYMGGRAQHSDTMLLLMEIFLYIILFIGASILIRKYRIQRGQ